MRKNFRLPIASLIALAALVSCNTLEVTMPIGPRGEQGIQGVPGKDGLSAYDLWVKAIQEKQIDYTGPVDINHFFIYLKGKDGADGTNGTDGKSAYELWKEYVMSGVDDPHNPGNQWDKSKTSMADFFWFLTGNNGSDGLIPYIKDGNWWIGDSDTGVKARGEKGDAGASGKNGIDGQSAYEMWKEYVRETISAGGTVTDQNGNVISLDDLSVQKFFQYLTGKAGDKGEKGDAGLDGKDGANGKDGLTPEIDPETGEWIFVNKESKDTVFTHIQSKGLDGKDGVDGKDGQDGATPEVGSNGNWWIGGVDTGIKAQGPKGDTGSAGKDGADGKDGVDGKDGADGKNGSDGKDGVNGSAGKSAYELWVADVMSASGLDDPKNPGHKWDPSKTSVADFYEYLRGSAGTSGSDGKDGVAGKDGTDGKDGADGADGKDGKSAYDLWKELVLSNEGLDNPDNGVYDADIYPKWPRSAVSILDFFKYLRGSNGESATSFAVVDTLYVEEADWTKYNVAPVRSMAKVKLVAEASDTTYEYVNPYSGGCALIVTEPGPIAIPNCTVRFNDQDGNSYEKTSDERGYIYLTRDELPEWHAGAPSISDLSSRTKPSSFSFRGKTITDACHIAATCGVPYKVKVNVKMTGSSWVNTRISATYVVTRTVEGNDETGWGGFGFPGSDAKTGYFMYRCLNDVNKFRKMDLNSNYETPADYIVGDHFMKFGNKGIENEWDRLCDTVPSTTVMPVKFGDGALPTVMDVNYVPVKPKEKKSYYDEPFPDYGFELESSSKTIIPEYCGIGGFNVSGVRGGSDDEPFTSYNDKLVLSEDGTRKVPVNKTNYELILGQTSFSFSFDYSTFGHVYERKAYYDSVTDTYRFKRYDTMLDYLAQTTPALDHKYATTLMNEGVLSGVTIRNSIPVYLNSKDGVVVADKNEPFIIRNVYDGFTMKFTSFSVKDMYYGEVEGTFHYKASDPYRASITIGGKEYVFQAILDSRSAPLP